MNPFKNLNGLRPARFAVASAVLLCGGLTGSPCAAAPDTNAAPPAASSPAPAAGAKPAITGAELYSIHCNRCHPERYPTERTAAQWKTIMLHMQVRANIPGKQARLILQYLQENSGR